MKKLIYLSLLILILCGCSNSSNVDNGKIATKIDTSTVYNEIDNRDVYIVDVRENDEYMTGHIKNSYNIPLSNLDSINSVVISLDSKIIVYCQGGNRSGIASKKLIEMGYTNVYDMGGINSWNYDLITD